METAQVTVRRPWWALVVSVVGAVVAGGLVLELGAGPTADADAHPMTLVAPAGVVELETLPAHHQDLYLAAAADEEAFTAVRCYCGCESFLGHQDLRACFLRPDGGWEAHATGCAVCIAEAEEVVELRQEGVPIEDIVDRIDARYGGIDLSSLT